MNYDEILEKVITTFSVIADTEEEITEDSELVDDLNISSMDILMILCNLEEEFHIKVPEKMIRRMTTIGDVAEVLESLM